MSIISPVREACLDSTALSSPTGLRVSTASDLVREGMTEYGRDVILNLFPKAVDGLKIVHRRFIAVMQKFQSYVSSKKAVGEVTTLHNHGDVAVYEALLRLAADFKHRIPLIDFDGNVGSYSGDKGAAMRYTDMTLSAFARDLFYNGIDTTALPKVLNKSLAEYEPSYFVPALPTALLLGNATIGVGFASLTLPLNLGDVCDLVIAYVEHVQAEPWKEFDYARHAERFIPDFPIENTITNRAELIAQYKRGNFEARVTIDGSVDLRADSIHIRTLPFTNDFSSVKSKLHEALDPKSKSYDQWLDQRIAEWKDLSNEVLVGHVAVNLKRGVDVFEVWERLSRLIQFSYALTPNQTYTTDDGYCYNASPVTVLATWYQHRRNILLSSKRYKLADLTKRKSREQAVLLITDYLDEVLAILRDNDEDAAIAMLCERFKVTRYQADYLASAPLRTICRTAKTELAERHARTLRELEELKLSFGMIAQEIVEEAKALKKKYALPRLTRVPRYIGYVGVGTGSVQFEDVAEIPEILEAFPRGSVEVHLHDGPHLVRVAPNGKPSEPTLHKYTTGDIYGLRFNPLQAYTVNIQGGAACCVQGFVPGLRKEGYFYTTKRSTVVERSGAVRVVDVTQEFSMRKSICRGANTDVIYVYPETPKRHYILVANDEEPNVLRLQAVAGDASRITLAPVGNLTIVHSFTGKDWYFSVPDKCLNRVGARVFCIVDAEALLKGERQVRITLNQSDWKRNKHFKML